VAPLAQSHIGKDIIREKDRRLGYPAGAIAEARRPRQNPRFLQENHEVAQVRRSQ